MPAGLPGDWAGRRADSPAGEWERLRLSDEERDAAARELGEHFATGRLTATEHGDRLDRVMAARTRGELPLLFADLPSAYARLSPGNLSARGYPMQGVSARPGQWHGPVGRVWSPPKVVLTVALVLVVLTQLPLVVVLVLAWVLVNSARRRRVSGPPWPQRHGVHPQSRRLTPR
jgi:hypothetical protein